MSCSDGSGLSCACIGAQILSAYARPWPLFIAEADEDTSGQECGCMIMGVGCLLCRELALVLEKLFLIKLVRISGFSSIFLAIAIFSAHFAREC